MAKKSRVAGDEVTRPSRASDDFARARRRAEVAGRYLRGETQARIAEDLKVNVRVVKADLQAVMDAWVKESKLAFEERKAKELAKIDHIELLAHRGWEASVERQEVHRSFRKRVRQAQRNEDNKVTGHRMVPVEETEETVIKGQSGDPRFLEQITRCIEMRLRILGLWKGESQAASQVLVDWTQLFVTQAQEAARRADEHEARRLGYQSLPPRPVEARDSIDHAPLDQDGTPRGAGIPPGRGGGDPIEERLLEEERSLGIKLPGDET